MTPLIITIVLPLALWCPPAAPVIALGAMAMAQVERIQVQSPWR